MWEERISVSNSVKVLLNSGNGIWSYCFSGCMKGSCIMALCLFPFSSVFHVKNLKIIVYVLLQRMIFTFIFIFIFFVCSNLNALHTHYCTCVFAYTHTHKYKVILHVQLDAETCKYQGCSILLYRYTVQKQLRLNPSRNDKIKQSKTDVYEIISHSLILIFPL